MPQLLTRLGLPMLREETYRGFMEEARRTRSYEESLKFLEALFNKIAEKDPLYTQFIKGTVDLWPEGIKEIACAELITGYELLAREGELPKLDPEKFERRWNATMNRAVAVLNAGHNLSIIEVDNPVYFDFIMNSQTAFPDFIQRTHLLSDLSSGYMFLADSVQREV
jgi:hypothetical protein